MAVLGENTLYLTPGPARDKEMTFDRSLHRPVGLSYSIIFGHPIMGL